MTNFDLRVQLFEDLEKDEEKRRRIGIARLMRRIDRQMQLDYELEHSQGYCPVCHCLRSLNGSCSCD